MVKIQSISDIITNSSSEVFIIDTKHHDLVSEFIKEVCDLFEFNIYDLMDFDSVTEDGYVDGYRNGSYKKGNLLIWSQGDNSIPAVIMDMIYNLQWTPSERIEKMEIKDIKRIHLG